MAQFAKEIEINDYPHGGTMACYAQGCTGCKVEYGGTFTRDAAFCGRKFYMRVTGPTVAQVQAFCEAVLQRMQSV